MLTKITQYYIILSQPNTRLAFVRNHIHVTPLDTSNFGGSCLFQSEHCKHTVPLEQNSVLNNKSHKTCFDMFFHGLEPQV